MNNVFPLKKNAQCVFFCEIILKKNHENLAEVLENFIQNIVGILWWYYWWRKYSTCLLTNRINVDIYAVHGYTQNLNDTRTVV